MLVKNYFIRQPFKLLISFNPKKKMIQLLICIATGFVGGLLTGVFVEKSKQKKLLKMENDMLKNHSRILALQQKVSLLESENNRLSKQ